MKLLVISDAHVAVKNGKKVAYAPYVREMDLWMQHVGETTIISPGNMDKPLLSKAFAVQDFKHIEVTRLDFHKFSSVVTSIFKIPSHAWLLWLEMKKADHIHLRAPGNLALLAGFVQISLSRKRKTVKYAGNWDPNAKQPFSYRLQKKMFAHPKWCKNTNVMAYGQWPRQSGNIKPFFTATYSKKERQSFHKELKTPLQFLFVGTLSPNKNPQLLVELVQSLNEQGIPAQAHFYGDGPMMMELAQLNSTAGGSSDEFRVQSSELGSHNDEVRVQIPADSKEGYITASSGADLQRLDGVSSSSNSSSTSFHFHGNQPSSVVKKAYEKAHFVFLASQSEGWPKAVAEGMWHGCVPIATPVSCVPWMLNNSELSREKEELKDEDKNKRGILYLNQHQAIEEIKNLIQNPELFKKMSGAAQHWSQQYTMEGFEEAIKDLLKS